MSGFCSDCGNTFCLCDEIEEAVEKYGAADAVEYYRNQVAECEIEIESLKEELRCSRQREWEPSEGIWRVRYWSGGRSMTRVAKPEVPEQEAIIRAVLETHADVVVKAIMDTYDTRTFCPTTFQHLDHEGNCGIFPPHYAIWEAVRDALAADLKFGSMNAEQKKLMGYCTHATDPIQMRSLCRACRKEDNHGDQ